MAFNEARFINKGKQEQPSVDEDVVKGNPIVEAVFKPRWNLPLLSKYTSAVGRAAKNVDKSIEEKVGTSKVINLGTLLGQYSLSGVNVSPGDIMSTVTPFIGDVETGKYSLFDIALGGAEVVPAGKILKKGSSKAIEKLISPPHPTGKQFQKKLKKVIKKGGKEKLQASLEWQKEWITDPETFLRQSGLRVNDPETFMFGRFAGGRDKEFLRLARKPNMSRSRMKKEGFADEWDSYIEYKDKMTKEFDRLEITEMLPYEYIEDTKGWRRLPDESMDEWRKRYSNRFEGPVKLGFTPEREGILGQFHPQYTIGDLQESLKYKQPVGAYSEQVSISPYPKDFPTTTVHELQHFTTKGDAGIPANISDYIESLKPFEPGPVGISRTKQASIRSIVDKWKKEDKTVSVRGGVKASKATNEELYASAKYLSSNTEIQARLQELRLSLKVKPGEKITERMLNRKLGKDFYRELELIIGKKNILKALNTLPAMVPMIVEEELFNEWDREDNIF